MIPANAEDTAKTGLAWVGAAMPVLASAAFLALWWDSYLAVTNDGWHFLGAWRILNGEIPYRDYYLFIPPFHQLKIAAIVSLFGKTLIAAQAVGFAERLVLAAVLYFWLRRVCGPSESALGSTFGLLVYYSASSETLSSMIHEAALWPVFAGACAAMATAKPNRRLWWAIAGVFGGIAFMTKQTSGVGIAFALFTFAGWRAVGRCGGSRERRDLLALTAGWLIPTSLIALWLYANGALPGFVDQVFVRGPASKGSAAQIAMRPVMMLVADAWQLRYTLASVALFAALIWATRLRFTLRPRGGGNLLWLGAGVAAAVALGAALGYSGGLPAHPFLQLAPVAITLRVTLLFSLAISIVAGARWVREGGPDAAQVFLLAWVSLWIAVFSSLSWALMAIMAVPGTPFAAAAALNAAPPGLPGRLWRVSTLAALLGAMAFLVQEKLVQPFDWASWTEPNVASATETSELPLLSGLHLSPETKSFVETVTAAIREGTEADQEVFVYPHMPLFYLLAERKPATFGPVHYFDVSPDYLARQDAARILERPPARIVYFRQSEAEIDWAEDVFRGGRRSGQRDLTAAIERLTRDGYDLVEDLRAPITGRSVQVWARRGAD